MSLANRDEENKARETTEGDYHGKVVGWGSDSIT